MEAADQRLRHPVPIAWQVFILFASIGVLIVLGATLFMPVPPEVQRVLNMADVGICLIFMIDFFVLLYLHNDRRKYLVTWGWIDFISSIPLVEPFRWGRLARFIRLLRLFRGVRGSSGLLRKLFLQKQETTAAAIFLLIIVVIVFSSVGILIAEEGSGSKIDTAEEALWFVLTTLTTVGYGDLVPVTALGRGVAALTMIAGIGIFGAFTALIASLLVRPSSDSATLERVAARLDQIETELNTRAPGERARSEGSGVDEPGHET